MMKRRTIFCAMLAMPFVSRVATATERPAVDMLRTFIKKTRGASGRFMQTVKDRNGNEAAAPSGGIFRFVRPGRFEWTYQTPYTQQILCDGKTVRIYDPDLMQVTERKLSGALPATPASMLFGDGDLERDWELTELGGGEVRAKLRQPESAFEAVVLGFTPDGTLHRMVLTDSFGQTTELTFSEIRPSSDLPGTFVLKVPEGVEVIEDLSGL